jgi:hypothetical protein
MIERQVGFNWLPLRPIHDGKEKVFLTRKAAEDYAYDYGHAGARNQRVRFVKYCREKSK